MANWKSQEIVTAEKRRGKYADVSNCELGVQKGNVGNAFFGEREFNVCDLMTPSQVVPGVLGHLEAI